VGIADPGKADTSILRVFLAAVVVEKASLPLLCHHLLSFVAKEA
jgi:hypothetical protein